MGERSAIEWTDATWNPWHGCTKVSEGCDLCYMYREKKQYGQDPDLVVRSKTTFTAPLKWNEPRRIFTCSWSDWFHEAADPWRAEAWEIIRRTPQHTYLILTKRPGRAPRHLPWLKVHGGPETGRVRWERLEEPWPHVWIGVSIESPRYEHRAALLCYLPVAHRFVSAEPLLEQITVARFLGRAPTGPSGIEWLIAGGESGPGWRPTDPAWLRILRDECAAAGVPFFLKQLGGWPDKRGDAQAVLDGRLHQEIPA